MNTASIFAISMRVIDLAVASLEEATTEFGEAIGHAYVDVKRVKLMLYTLGSFNTGLEVLTLV